MNTKKEEKPSGSSATAQGAGGASGASSGSQKATGQKVSKERGSHTNSKKNPGKRPHQGGSSA